MWSCVCVCALFLDSFVWVFRVLSFHLSTFCTHLHDFRVLDVLLGFLLPGRRRGLCAIV